MPVKELMDLFKRTRETKQKPKGYPFTPDETVKVKEWTIRFYKSEGMATCFKHGTNVTYVIDERTEDLSNIPRYVRDELTRRIFLKEWQRKKINQSVGRLSEISKKLEKMRAEGKV